MINWHPTKADLLSFLRTQDLCTLATIDYQGWPLAATVAFSENDLLELMIGTSKQSRKYANLNDNPWVAVTVTDPERRLTMQYQGVAWLPTNEELAVREPVHYAKLPGSLPFKDQPGETFWVIQPVHIQFSDCQPLPWLVGEFTF